MNVNYVSVGMEILLTRSEQRLVSSDSVSVVLFFFISSSYPTSRFSRLFPPFGQYRILQKMQNVRCVTRNFISFMGLVDALVRSFGSQQPDFDLTAQDKIILGLGVQISRPHDRSFGIEQVDAHSADS